MLLAIAIDVQNQIANRLPGRDYRADQPVNMLFARQPGSRDQRMPAPLLILPLLESGQTANGNHDHLGLIMLILFQLFGQHRLLGRGCHDEKVGVRRVHELILIKVVPEDALLIRMVRVIMFSMHYHAQFGWSMQLIPKLAAA